VNAAATPIHLLTEDQAVEEMDRLLSTQPSEADFLDLLKWEQAHRQTVTQLQAHILHLQRLAAQQGQPTEPITPPPAPEAKEEPAMPTTQPEIRNERLDRLCRDYLQLLAELQENPADQPKRNKASILRSNALRLADKIGADVPDLPRLPELPYPAPSTHPAVPVPAAKAAPTPIPPREPDPVTFREETVALVEKICAPVDIKKVAVPYEDVTADTLRAALRLQPTEGLPLPTGGWIPEPEPVLPGPSTRAAPLRSPCAEDCTCHLHDHQVHINVQATDAGRLSEFLREAILERLPIRKTVPSREGLVPDPEPDPAPILQVIDPATLARAIARSIWPLCEALDCLAPQDRLAVRPALDAIHARLQVAYLVVDEGEGENLAAG
jgi:hypothetical protein